MGGGPSKPAAEPEENEDENDATELIYGTGSNETNQIITNKTIKKACAMNRVDVVNYYLKKFDFDRKKLNIKLILKEEPNIDVSIIRLLLQHLTKPYPDITDKEKSYLYHLFKEQYPIKEDISQTDLFNLFQKEEYFKLCTSELVKQNRNQLQYVWVLLYHLLHDEWDNIDSWLKSIRDLVNYMKLEMLLKMKQQLYIDIVASTLNNLRNVDINEEIKEVNLIQPLRDFYKVVSDVIPLDNESLKHKKEKCLTLLQQSENLINNKLPTTNDIKEHLENHEIVELYSQIYKNIYFIIKFKSTSSLMGIFELFKNVDLIVSIIRAKTTPHNVLSTTILETVLNSFEYHSIYSWEEFHDLKNPGWHELIRSMVLEDPKKFQTILSEQIFTTITIINRQFLEQLKQHFHQAEQDINHLISFFNKCPDIDINDLTNEEDETILHVLAKTTSSTIPKLEENLKTMRSEYGGEFLKSFVNKTRSTDGNTALHLAAFSTNVNLVKILIKYGAEYSILNSKGLTAKDLTNSTVIKNYIERAATCLTEGEVMKIINIHNIPLNVNNHDISYLFNAIEIEDNDFIQKTIDKNKSYANKKSISGEPFIFKAIENGNETIVSFLLLHDVDLTAVYKGITVLHKAVYSGYWRIVNNILDSIVEGNLFDLIDKPTDDDVRDTALHIAGKMNFFLIGKSLLEHGAQYNLLNNLEKTPLDLISTKDSTFFKMLQTINELDEQIQNDALCHKQLKKIEEPPKPKRPQGLQRYRRFATNHWRLITLNGHAYPAANKSHNENNLPRKINCDCECFALFWGFLKSSYFQNAVWNARNRDGKTILQSIIEKNGIIYECIIDQLLNMEYATAS